MLNFCGYKIRTAAFMRQDVRLLNRLIISTLTQN